LVAASFAFCLLPAAVSVFPAFAAAFHIKIGVTTATATATAKAKATVAMAAPCCTSLPGVNRKNAFAFS